MWAWLSLSLLWTGENCEFLLLSWVLNSVNTKIPTEHKHTNEIYGYRIGVSVEHQK